MRDEDKMSVENLRMSKYKYSFTNIEIIIHVKKHHNVPKKEVWKLKWQLNC